MKISPSQISENRMSKEHIEKQYRCANLSQNVH